MWGKHNRLRNIYQFLIPVSGSQFTGSQAVFNEVSGTTAIFNNYTGPAGTAATFASATIGSLNVGQTHISGAQGYVDPRNYGTGVSFDFGTGNYAHTLLSSATSSITFGSMKAGGVYVCKLQYSGSDAFQVDWPASVKWPNNVAPLIKNYIDTGSIAGQDIFTFYFDGTTAFGGAFGQRYDY